MPVRPVTAATVAAATIVAGLLLTGGAAARQAATPIIPAAAECTVEPLSRRELRPIAAAALARDETSPAAPSPPARGFAPPAGVPAPPAVVTAVERTVRLSFACLNAGDLPAALALSTTDWAVASLVAGRRATEAAGEASAATPAPDVDPERRVAAYVAAIQDTARTTPEASQRQGFRALRDVVVLSDGRVSALLEGVETTGGEERPFTAYVFFRRNGDRYLIDGSIAVEIVATTGATPAT